MQNSNLINWRNTTKLKTVIKYINKSLQKIKSVLCMYVPIKLYLQEQEAARLGLRTLIWQLLTYSNICTYLLPLHNQLPKEGKWMYHVQKNTPFHRKYRLVQKTSCQPFNHQTLVNVSDNEDLFPYSRKFISIMHDVNIFKHLEVYSKLHLYANAIVLFLSTTHV